MPRISQKAQQFTESVIREMTRLCNQHNGINLAQGFPDFSAPEEMKEAACRAIHDDVNQYAITWGRRISGTRLLKNRHDLTEPENRSGKTCNGVLRFHRGDDLIMATMVSGRRDDCF